MTLPVAVITGAGSGIGRAVALNLAADHRVILAGRRLSQLQETGALITGEWFAVTADVAQPADVANLIDTTVGRFNRLDVLVNNAGMAPLRDIDKTDPDTIEKTYQVNAMGPANAIARAWPIFKRQQSGCVVNISTMGTEDPFPGFFAYAASKAAVEVMAKSCASEGAAVGVRAFAVAPGAVETPMLRGLFNEQAIPPGACLAPDDVAAVVADCVRGNRNDMNGQTIRLQA